MGLDHAQLDQALRMAARYLTVARQLWVEEHGGPAAQERLKLAIENAKVLLATAEKHVDV